LTHIDRSPVDAELASRQWAGYVTALEENGWTIIEVPPAEDCPDSAFVEDTMVVYADLAVIARPGAEQRQPETAAAEATVAAAGYRTAHVTEPATLDGGDVLKIGNRVYVGVGGRTNDLGVAQLREHLTPLGAEVIAVPVTKVLHLKSAVTALPDGTVIGYEPLVDDPGAFDSFLAVPEDTGSHVVVLDEETVLMSSSATRTVELLADRGLEVLAVDISEFERLEGCVTCLSVRLRG
jgi:dimethylargininase